jgi:hypothetical protein
MTVDRNACGIPDKGNAIHRFEIGDVVGGVAGSVDDLELMRTESEALAAFEWIEVYGGNRQKFAEQLLQILSVETRSTLKKPGRVDHVGHSTRVDIDLQVRVLANERAGGGSMVKMDMSQEDGGEIGNGYAMLLELFAKSGECRGGTRVDERGVMLGAKKSGGNRARMAGPV